MSFGRNPHVTKAEAAEQKARSATDDAAYELAWREAARMWDRAAEREKDEKRRKLYAERAQSARTSADEPRAMHELSLEPEDEPAQGVSEPPGAESPARADRKTLN